MHISDYFKDIKKLKLLLGLCLLNIYLISQAQDPMFSQFMFKQLYFNPANAGTTENARIMGGYRNQWPGMGNAFTTYYLSYDQSISSINSGIGFTILRDAIGNGTFNNTGFDLNYNYQTKINRNLNMSFGLSGAMYQKARSSSDVVLPEQSPYETGGGTTEYIPNTSKWYPDFGFGIYSLYKQKHWFSFAVHHLNMPNVSLNSDINRYPMRFTFQYVTEIDQYTGKFSDKKMIYRPGIIYQQQSRYNYVSAGTNFEYQPMVYGLWLRSDNSLSVESVIFLIGFSVTNVKLVYSYDMRLINFSKNIVNNGAHEVTFQIDFKYNDRKKMRQVKCPKF